MLSYEVVQFLIVLAKQISDVDNPVRSQGCTYHPTGLPVRSQGCTYNPTGLLVYSQGCTRTQTPNQDAPHNLSPQSQVLCFYIMYPPRSHCLRPGESTTFLIIFLI